VFEDADNIYFVIELLKGGELFDVIQANGHISEEEAAVVIRKLAFALEALHRHGIIHRDIKLENLVLTKGNEYQRTPYENAMQSKFNNDAGSVKPTAAGQAGGSYSTVGGGDNDSVWSEVDEPNEFKITDFGFSQEVGQADAFDTPAGTLGYVAPEVLSDRTYKPACDVWSMGVVLYMLLSGQAPFPLHPDADNAKTLKERLDYELEAINYGRAPKVWYAHFEEEPWTHISSDAKNLLSKMLKVNPHKRISVEGVLRHPWIKRHQLGTQNEYLNFE
jgi:serine/threonine protein kinase